MARTAAPHVDDNLALGIGQVEEAMGLLKDQVPPATGWQVYQALVRAREFLVEATTAADARVPLAHYTPISGEDSGP